MTHRRPIRSRHARSAYLMETLEPREVFSASYATLVMEAPRTGIPAIQTDHNAQGTAVSGATQDTALDIQVRITASGIYLTVAASSVDLMKAAPTGTIDINDETDFLGTVSLGGAVRSTLVLPAGSHTFFATYIGDATFKPSNTSITVDLPNPTTTLPLNASDNNDYATNGAGERIRASRFLSTINFFDAHNLAVSAIPPVPLTGGVPGNTGAVSFTVEPGDPIPTPRFSKITFSLTLAKLSGSH